MNDIFPTTHVRHKEFAHGLSIFEPLPHYTRLAVVSPLCAHEVEVTSTASLLSQNTSSTLYHPGRSMAADLQGAVPPLSRERVRHVPANASNDFKTASSLETLHWLEVLTT